MDGKCRIGYASTAALNSTTVQPSNEFNEEHNIERLTQRKMNHVETQMGKKASALSNYNW